MAQTLGKLKLEQNLLYMLLKSISRHPEVTSELTVSSRKLPEGQDRGPALLSPHLGILTKAITQEKQGKVTNWDEINTAVFVYR